MRGRFQAVIGPFLGSLIVIVLGGCAAPGPREATGMETLHLCQRLGYYLRNGDMQTVTVLEDELRRRGEGDYVPSYQERQIIMQETPVIGMHVCTLMAAMALGPRPYRLNYTRTATGTRAQFVIPPYGFAHRGYYVYVDIPPGRVVSLQNY